MVCFCLNAELVAVLVTIHPLMVTSWMGEWKFAEWSQQLRHFSSICLLTVIYRSGSFKNKLVSPKNDIECHNFFSSKQHIDIIFSFLFLVSLIFYDNCQIYICKESIQQILIESWTHTRQFLRLRRQQCLKQTISLSLVNFMFLDYYTIQTIKAYLHQALHQSPTCIMPFNP